MGKVLPKYIIPDLVVSTEEKVKEYPPRDNKPNLVVSDKYSEKKYDKYEHNNDMQPTDVVPYGIPKDITQNLPPGTFQN